MIRLGSVVGLPVIRQGRMVGRVEQTVLTCDGRRLRGLVVRHGLGGAHWVAEGDVSVLGQVSVIITGKPGKMPQDADFSLGQVKDTGGLQLGWVTDVYLRPRSREVAALEIDLGPLESMRTGRLLARNFSVAATREEPGLVLVPCGCALEKR